jgi:hypothetical protein
MNGCRPQRTVVAAKELSTVGKEFWHGLQISGNKNLAKLLAAASIGLSLGQLVNELTKEF